MKSAFVALVGRPSSGKSTLLNQFCGHKVAIVSPVPQTTRNKIRGICHREGGQLVFIDTPGFHISERKFNRHLTNLILSAVREVDLILYLIDRSRLPAQEELGLMDLLAPFKGQLLVALNKSDIQPTFEREIRDALDVSRFDRPVSVCSGLTGEGCDELLERLLQAAPEGEAFYPDDLYTDQEPEFRIAEIIREKAISQVRQEIPHSVFVDIADAELEDDVLWVRGFLCVERESQKGIMVGKKGSRIKQIRMEAEKELAGMFPYRVKLDLRVKAVPKWRRDSRLIKKLIR